MNRVRDACQDLVTGSGAQRLRAWQWLPELVATAEARARSRTRPNSSAGRMIDTDDCLKLLATPFFTRWAATQTGEEWRLPWLRQRLARLMVRHVLPRRIRESKFRLLVQALGSGNDPFRHIRNWTRVFTPGRPSVTTAELPGDVPEVVYSAGLLRREGKAVIVHAPLVVFLWHDLLRCEVESAHNSLQTNDLLRQLAVVPGWLPVMRRLAGHLGGVALSRLIVAAVALDQPTEYRALIAASILLRSIPVDRRSAVNRDLVSALAERVVALASQLASEGSGSLGADRYKDLRHALNRMASWLEPDERRRRLRALEQLRLSPAERRTARPAMGQFGAECGRMFSLTSIARWIQTGGLTGDAGERQESPDLRHERHHLFLIMEVLQKLGRRAVPGSAGNGVDGFND